jgi:hypothetical protein
VDTTTGIRCLTQRQEFVESPLRRESHGGFGGRAGETDLRKRRHRAPARPDTLVSVAHAFYTLQRLANAPKDTAPA